MFRDIERRRIFLDDDDRNALLERLGTLIRSSDAKILAWVLLSNHGHVLFRSSNALGVSRFCQCLLGGYASSFNRRHRRYGHLFQGRFKSILVEEEPYLLELLGWVDGALRGPLTRQAQWSESVAVGGRPFAEQVLRDLGGRARDRRVESVDGVYVVRECAQAYVRHFAPENAR